MLQSISVGAVLVVYSLSLYGWGRLAEKIVRVRVPWPLTVGIGLAVCVFLGGLANLFHLALGFTLDGIVLAGLIASIWIGYTRYRQDRTALITHLMGSRSGLLKTLPGTILIIAIFLFLADTRANPGVFNPHDDLEKYFAFPIRMLGTGSLDGGIFSALGWETLGAQAYLHGFVAAHWPMGFMNSVDALFGLILCLVIVLVVGHQAKIPIFLVTLSVAAVFFINPQYVNISTLYIGSVLFLNVAFLSFGREDNGEPIQIASPRIAALFGLLYATLAALKTTFVLASLVHFPLAIAAVAVTTRRVKPTIIWALTAILIGLVTIIPWILVHGSKLYAGLLTLKFSAVPRLGVGNLIEPAQTIGLFSFASIRYGFGSSYIYYTALAFFAAVCGFVIYLRSRRRDTALDPVDVWSIGFCAMALISFLISHFIIGRHFLEWQTALRYVTPILIVAFPAATILAAKSLIGADRRIIGHPPKFSLIGMAFSLPAVLILGLFLGPLSKRIKLYNRIKVYIGSELVQNYRPGLSKNVPLKLRILQYSRFALDGRGAAEVAAIQRIIPAGASVVAWIALPMHLDFRRNQIYDVQPAGIRSPWSAFPFDKGVDGAVDFFRTHGIRYVIWQDMRSPFRSPQNLSGDPNPRKSNSRRAALKRTMVKLAAQADVIHDDGKYTIIRIRGRKSNQVR